ncbi:hypothetical protein V8E36_001618 [Tilletia maclaganii]
METLQQLDEWFEDVLPTNLAALPTRIADTLSSTSQIIIDQSQIFYSSLTQYGPIIPSSPPSPSNAGHSPNSSSAEAPTLIDILFGPSHAQAAAAPQSKEPTPAATTTTTTTTITAASLITLGLGLSLTSLLFIGAARPGFSAHYAGSIWVPFLPGDLTAHLHALFYSVQKRSRRPQVSGSSAATGTERTEAIVVLGADTPLGRTIALHLATTSQGYIVFPVVSTPQALQSWAALTPPSSRGYIAPLLLDAQHGVDQLRQDLDALLARRYPLTTAGEPYARPGEHIRLIGVVNTLSWFESSSLSQPTELNTEEPQSSRTSSATSTPSHSIILEPNAHTDTSTLSEHLSKHVLSPLAAIETILPILRKHASSRSSSASEGSTRRGPSLRTALVLNLRPGPSSSSGSSIFRLFTKGRKASTTTYDRTEDILHAALDRAFDSLRQERDVLDRAERGRGSRSRRAGSSSSRRSAAIATGGGAEDGVGLSGHQPYRAGQFDARFVPVEAEAQSTARSTTRSTPSGSRFGRSAPPSVKIVDLQLADWVAQRPSSDSTVPASTSASWTSTTGTSSSATLLLSSSSASQQQQGPHPFQTRATPASQALLPVLGDVMRLFAQQQQQHRGGLWTRGSAARRCPEKMSLRLPRASPLGRTWMTPHTLRLRAGEVWARISRTFDSALRSGASVPLVVNLQRRLSGVWNGILHGMARAGAYVGLYRPGGRRLGAGRRRTRDGHAGSSDLSSSRRATDADGDEEEVGGVQGYEILPPAAAALSNRVAGAAARSRSSQGQGQELGGRQALRPSPYSRQLSGSGSGLSSSSSPASSVKGMVLPSAPSASASPPLHSTASSASPGQALNAGQASGSGSAPGASTAGSATPLSVSASVMELPPPSSVTSSAYGEIGAASEGEDVDVDYDSYESGVESNASGSETGSGPLRLRRVGYAGAGAGLAEVDSDRTPGVEEHNTPFSEMREDVCGDQGRNQPPAGSVEALPVSGSTVLGDSWVDVPERTPQAED